MNTGVLQTLYNLFKAYPGTLTIQYESNEELKVQPKLNASYWFLPTTTLRPLNNTIGQSGYNRFTNFFNHSLLFLKPLRLSVQEADHDLILVCATHSSKLLLAYKISRRYDIPLIPYFMDNWMQGRSDNWVSGNTHSLINSILKASPYWLTISLRLQQTLERNYKVIPHSCHHVHNPVDDTMVRPEVRKNFNIQFVISYAGSLYDMHYDAVVALALAINELNSSPGENKCVLHIYTSEGFYKHRKELFNLRYVKYKGFLHQGDLQAALSCSGLLLVASSFRPENAHMVVDSLQTKVTDYMSCGVCLLAIGPPYSICNEFVEKHDVGYSITTTERGSLVRLLQDIMRSTDRIEKAENGLRLVKAKYLESIVQDELYAYLQRSYHELKAARNN